MVTSVIRSTPRNVHGEQGFTLIELSIVLVIIGLIVGGVLVGQDLIKAAEIRATISQIERYNTAVNTFRNKYNAIPGDIAGTMASSFGLYFANGGALNAAGYGDGNGLIEGGGSLSTLFQGEPPITFLHMTQANLIDGSYGQNGPTSLVSGASSSGGSGTGLLNAAVTAGSVMQVMPPAKLGRGNYITVGSNQGYNYWLIAGIQGVSTAGAYSSGTDQLTPVEAYNIDKKTDDGSANSGTIQAADATGAVAGVAAASATSPNASAFSNAGGNTTNGSTAGSPTTGCANGSTYSLGGTLGSAQSCSLRLRFN